MFGQCIAALRHQLIDALEVRDAAYLRYIHSDRSEFGVLYTYRSDLDKANVEVAQLRREIQIGVK